MSRHTGAVGSLLVATLVGVVFLSGASAVELGEDQTTLQNYHRALRSQPEPGYLFDRFYNTWFDHGTVDELEVFLQAQVEQTGAAADRLLLAFFYVKQGEPVQAITTLERALEAEPAHATAWYHKGRLLAETLDFEAALEDLARAREAEPGEELALEIGKLEGKLHARTGEPERAREIWRELLERQADDEYLYEDLIELQLEEGLHEQAQRTAEALIERTADPYQRVMRRLRLGDIHEYAGEREQALAVYGTSLERVGGGSWLEREIVAQIERVFRREDDLAGLREHYEQLLAEHGQRVAVRRQYADLLSELNERDAALEQWQAILELTPGEREHREAYARRLAEMGRPAEAIEQVEALIEQHGGDAELRVQLAELQHEADRDDQAIETLHAYLESSDGSLFSYLRTARLMERFGHEEEAAEVHERAVEVHGEDEGARRAYAEFLYRVERTDEALTIWRALAANAGLPELLNVGRTLAARGEHEAAFEVLRDRLADYEHEPRFLAALCEQAARVERYEAALPWARQWVRQADSDEGFLEAVSQAAQLIEQADRLAATVRELEAQSAAERGVGETCLLAALLERQGRSDEADARLASVRDEAPVRVLRQQARLQRDRHDWAGAAETIETLLVQAGGERVRHLRELVTLHERAQQTDAALRWVRRWKELVPNNASPWVREAELEMATGQSEQGLETLRRAVQRFDEDQDLRARLAQAYQAHGQLADAQRHYQRLYEQSDEVTQKVHWIAEVAEVAQQRGRLRQLVQRFEQQRQRHRDRLLPHLALAEIHRVANDYEQRRQALMQAGRLEPNNVELLLSIARIEEREGDYERALETLTRAAEVDPGQRAEQRMARLLLMQGEREKAYRLLYELAGGEHIDARGLEGIADTMAADGDWDGVIELLREHRSRFEQDYRLAYLHAVALEEAMLTDAAVEAFLEVLRLDEELPTVGTSQQQTPWSAYTGELQKLLPSEASRLVRLQWQSHQAYSHRRGSRMGMVASAPGAGGASTVTLPDTLEAARDLATVHLSALSATFDDARRDQLAEAMRRAGVALPEVMLAMAGQQPGAGQLPLDVVETHADEPAVLAYWLMQSMDGGGGPDGHVYGERAFEMFREDHPQLALLGMLVAVRAEPDEAERFEEALAPLLERVDEPSVFTVMAMARFVGAGMLAAGQAPALPTEFRELLIDQMVAWSDTLSTSQVSGMGPYIFMSLAALLWEEERFGTYVGLLEREVRAWRQRGAGTSGASGPGMMMWPTPQGEALLEPLTFPPQDLPDLPPHVAQLLVQARGRASMGVHGPMPAVRDETALLEHLESIGEPTLKVLLAHHVGERAMVEATLEGMLEAEAPALGAYLLAAGYAANEADDRQRAVTLLDTARYLPMSAQQRRRLDASLVAWALEAPVEAQEVQEIGRQAALRLRRAQLSREHREELALALEDLGLGEEAEALQQAEGGGLLGHLARSFTGGTQPSAATAGPVSGGDRITQLMENEREDAAASTAAQQLRQWARAMLAPQGGSVSVHQRDQLIQTIEHHGLVERVRERLRPEEGASPRSRLNYAVVREILGDTEPALALYRELVEQRPNDDMLKWRLAALTAEEDPREAAALLEDISARTWMSLGARVSQRLRAHGNEPFERQLAMFEMLAYWLEGTAVSERVDLSWMPQVMNTLGRQQHLGTGRQLPSVYDYDSDDSSGMDSELIERRRAVYGRLSEAMLEVPALAEDGFKRRLALAEAAGEDLEPFVAIAERVVLEATQAPTPQGAGRHIVYHFGGSSDEVTHWTPGQFLVRDAWRRDDRDHIEEAILSALRERGRPDAADELEQFARLYFAPAEEFTEVAEAYVEGQARRSSMPQAYFYAQGGGEAMRMILHVWEERGLSADLVPLVVQQLEQQGQMGGFSFPSYFHGMAESLYQREGGDGVRRLFEALAEAMIGPEEQRVELVERHYDRNQGFSGPGPGARIYMFIQQLEQLQHHISDEPALMLFALEQLCELGVTEGGNWQWRVRNMVDELSGGAGRDRVQVAAEWLRVKGTDEDLDRYRPLLELLEASRLLAEPKRFMAYRFGSGAEQSVLGTLTDRLHQQHDEARAAVRRWLAEREEPGFGAGLVKALMAPSPAAAHAEALDYLGRRPDALGQLAAPSREALADILVPAEADLDDLALTEPAREAADQLAALRDTSMRSAIEALLEAQRVSDLNMHARSLGDHIQPFIATLLPHERDTARDVVAKALDLVHDAQRRGQYNITYGDGGSAGGHLVEGLLREVQSAAIAGIAIELIRDRRTKPVEMVERASRRLREPFGETLEEASERQPDETAPPERLAAGCEALAAHLPAGNLSVLMALFSEHIQSWESAHLREVAAWMDEIDDADTDPVAALRREAAMAAALWLADRARDGEGSGETGVPDDLGEGVGERALRTIAYYVDVLADETLSRTYRLHVGEQFMTQALWPELRLAAAEAGVDAIRHHGTPVADHSVERVTRGLRQMPGAFASLDHERWAASVRDLVSAYRQRQGGSSSHAVYRRHRLPDLLATGDPQRQDMSVPMLMLDLALQADAPDAARRLLDVDDAALAKEAGAWMLLVRHGQMDLAARTVRRHAHEVDTAYPRELYYDASLAQAMPELREALEAPHHRYFAELLLAAAPDEAGDQGARDRRLAELVEEFEVLAGHQALRHHALLMIGWSDAALVQVSDALAAEVEAWEVARLFSRTVQHVGWNASRAGQTQREHQRRQRLVALHARARALIGNGDALATLAEVVVEHVTNDWQRRQGLEALGRMFDETVVERLDERRLEELASFLPALAHLARPPASRSFSVPHRRRAQLHVIIHVLADREDELRAWRDELSDRERSRLRNTRVSDDLWSRIASLLLEPDPMAVERRAERLAAVLRDPDLRNWLDVEGGFFKRIEEAGLLDSTQLQKHGHALARAAPRHGRSWLELAQRLEDADEAERAWQQAAAAATVQESAPDPDTALEVAAGLIEAEHPALAREVLDAIESPNRGHRSRRDDLLDRLSIDEADEDVGEGAAERPEGEKG